MVQLRGFTQLCQPYCAQEIVLQSCATATLADQTAAACLMRAGQLASRLRKYAAAQRSARIVRRVIHHAPNTQTYYCQYLWRCNRESSASISQSHATTDYEGPKTKHCETSPQHVASTAPSSARITSSTAQLSAQQVGLLGSAATNY